MLVKLIEFFSDMKSNQVLSTSENGQVLDVDQNNKQNEILDKGKGDSPCIVGAATNVLDTLSLDEGALKEPIKQESEKTDKDNNCSEENCEEEAKNKTEAATHSYYLAKLVGKKH